MSALHLKSIRKLPPGGFAYRCPACGWKIKNPLVSWSEIKKEIGQHERNNANHGAGWEEIELRLHTQTCARVPDWCTDGKPVILPQGEGGCVGCGRKKKAK